MKAETALWSLLAHGAGDYVLQSDWVAQEKTKAWPPAIAHAVSYGLPFLALTRSRKALAVIVATHAVIDRYRLARHLVWAKNQLAPAPFRYPWVQCKGTGYHPDRPDWLTVWLLIAADNICHVAVNTAALSRWGTR